MNERDLDFGTLDLEDIIREFGGGEDSEQLEEEEPVQEPEKIPETGTEQEIPEQAVAEPEPAEAEPEAIEEKPEEEPAAAEMPEEEPEAVQENAVQAEEPAKEEGKEPAADPTVRLDDLSQVVTEAPQAEEVSVELAQEEAAPSDEKPAEETEEEPADEDEEADDEVEVNLPHLPPLIFRPKSRLGELKRKLVAGPEKRYYELAEVGVGKVQIAMLLSLVVILVSGAAAVLFNAGMIPENRMRLMVFSQVLAMLVGGLLGSQQMIEGISDLFHGKFTLNTLLTITFAACCVDSAFCFMELRVPICAAFTLEVAMSLWGTYHKRTTEMGQMDTMRKAVRLDGVAKCDEYYEGRTGFLRKEGQVEDFMEHYDEVGGPEKLQRRYAMFSLLASIAIAVVAGVFHGVSMAFQILTTTLLASVPASMFITLTRPAAVLERRLHSLGTVLCGWSGVKGLCGKGVIPLKDHDLFPMGTAKLNGVKFYGDRDPEETIAYATALISANGGSLAPIFEQLLSSRAGIRYQAANLQHYGNGGIGGEVCDEPVLMGTMEFLKEMGVEVPEGTMVKQAVYVSIDGELSGLFAITYTRTKFAANGLATLHNYRRVVPAVVAKDFMLTAPFLKEKFGVVNKRMIFPTREEKNTLDQKQPAEDAPVLALTTQEGLAPVAYAITGARALRTASRLGMAIHLIGGLLGILIMLALAILGTTSLLTPVHVLLYQLIWMAPGLLVTMWPRTI